MPCYEPESDPYYLLPNRNRNLDINVPTPIDNSNKEAVEFENYELHVKIKQLEAGLCAIITELEKRGIDEEIMLEAMNNGSVDLKSFWKSHNEKDLIRLSKELDKFSEHEKRILYSNLENHFNPK